MILEIIQNYAVFLRQAAFNNPKMFLELLRKLVFDAFANHQRAQTGNIIHLSDLNIAQLGDLLHCLNLEQHPTVGGENLERNAFVLEGLYRSATECIREALDTIESSDPNVSAHRIFMREIMRNREVGLRGTAKALFTNSSSFVKKYIEIFLAEGFKEQIPALVRDGRAQKMNAQEIYDNIWRTFMAQSNQRNLILFFRVAYDLIGDGEEGGIAVHIVRGMHVLHLTMFVPIYARVYQRCDYCLRAEDPDAQFIRNLQYPTFVFTSDRLYYVEGRTSIPISIKSKKLRILKRDIGINATDIARDPAELTLDQLSLITRISGYTLATQQTVFQDVKIALERLEQEFNSDPRLQKQLVASQEIHLQGVYRPNDSRLISKIAAVERFFGQFFALMVCHSILKEVRTHLVAEVPEAPIIEEVQKHLEELEACIANYRQRVAVGRLGEDFSLGASQQVHAIIGYNRGAIDWKFSELEVLVAEIRKVKQNATINALLDRIGLLRAELVAIYIDDMVNKFKPTTACVPFVGRAEELKILEHKSNNIVVVEGVRCVGKTHFVHEFIAKNREQYEIIFTFDARSQDTLHSDFVRHYSSVIAMERRIGLTTHVNAFKGWLDSFRKQKQCLLVFDNVRNYEDIAQFLLQDLTNIEVILIGQKIANLPSGIVGINLAISPANHVFLQQTTEVQSVPMQALIQTAIALNLEWTRRGKIEQALYIDNLIECGQVVVAKFLAILEAGGPVTAETAKTLVSKAFPIIELLTNVGHSYTQNPKGINDAIGRAHSLLRKALSLYNSAFSDHAGSARPLVQRHLHFIQAEIFYYLGRIHFYNAELVSVEEAGQLFQSALGIYETMKTDDIDFFEAMLVRRSGVLELQVRRLENLRRPQETVAVSEERRREILDLARNFERLLEGECWNYDRETGNFGRTNIAQDTYNRIVCLQRIARVYNFYIALPSFSGYSPEHKQKIVDQVFAISSEALEVAIGHGSNFLHLAKYLAELANSYIHKEELSQDLARKVQLLSMAEQYCQAAIIFESQYNIENFSSANAHFMLASLSQCKIGLIKPQDAEKIVILKQAQFHANECLRIHRRLKTADLDEVQKLLTDIQGYLNELHVGQESLLEGQSVLHNRQVFLVGKAWEGRVFEFRRPITYSSFGNLVGPSLFSLLNLDMDVLNAQNLLADRFVRLLKPEIVFDALIDKLPRGCRKIGSHESFEDYAQAREVLQAFINYHIETRGQEITFLANMHCSPDARPTGLLDALVLAAEKIGKLWIWRKGRTGEENALELVHYYDSGVAAPPAHILVSAQGKQLGFSRLCLLDIDVCAGLQYQKVAGDGSCLYRAVTYYLGHGEDVALLRNLVAANLAANAERYQGFILLRDGQSLEDYIADIGKTSAWAGELEINILMHLLDRPIVIVGPENTIRNREIITQYRGKEPIFVYYNGVDHYDALILRDGYNSEKILTDMLRVTQPAVAETGSLSLPHKKEGQGSDAVSSSARFFGVTQSEGVTVLEVYPGLQYQKVAGDGSCLYRAVTYYLGHGEDVALLRNLVAANLAANAERYQGFILLRDGQSLEDYIADIGKTSAWAGELEINILMHLLDRPIVIVGPENTIRNREIITQYRGKEPIFVYYNGVDHYDALILRDGYNSEKILTDMLRVTQPAVAETGSLSLPHKKEGQGSDAVSSSARFFGVTQSEGVTVLEVYPGLQYQKVAGDGSCLYRAVTYYLGHGEDVALLRNLVAANLAANAAGYQDFIPLRDEQSLEDYIADIVRTNAWAGELEINILMRLLDRPIVIVGPENTIRNRDIVNQYLGKEPIFVYYNGVDHYDALILQDGYNSDDILTEMLRIPLDMMDRGAAIARR